MTTPSTSLQKACRLLRALTDARNSRLTDLALAAGVDKASALRLLETLAAEGLVERDPATKAFTPGREWLALHAASASSAGTRYHARIRIVAAYAAGIFDPNGAAAFERTRDAGFSRRASATRRRSPACAARAP